MNAIGNELRSILGTLSSDDSEQMKARRAATVAIKWKNAVVKVYKNHAPLVLSHINSVYILHEDDIKKLVLYVDDSMVRADLDSMQEFLKMALMEQGECIGDFSVRAARGTMKDRHVYSHEETPEIYEFLNKETQRRVQAVQLSQSEKNTIERVVKDIDDISVKKALEKAMTAQMKSKHIK